MAQIPKPNFSLPLTFEEKRQIERLARREGVSVKEAVLHAVERALRTGRRGRRDGRPSPGPVGLRRPGRGGP